MSDLAFYVGLLAGILTTISNLPQLIKSWKTKSTKDVSLKWLLLLGIGILVWLVYGFMIDELPIIIANFFGFILVLGLIFLKIKYG